LRAEVRNTAAVWGPIAEHGAERVLVLPQLHGAVDELVAEVAERVRAHTTIYTY